MTTIRGILYPLQLTEDGSLRTAEDAELIRGHIYSAIETYKLERIMQPQYGLPNLIFTSVNDLPVILERIRISLKSAVSDCDFKIVGEIADEGDLKIHLNWALGNITMPPIQYRITNLK